MLFKAPVLAAIAEGRVSLAFRRWRKPTVRAGGTLTTPVGVLAIDRVEVVEADTVTEADARAAGYASREALMADLPSEGPLYRIAFRLGGEDPRKAMRQDASGMALDEVAAKLAKMDAKLAWTTQVLRLVGENPGVRAPDLAARLGRESLPFKVDVRKLKALGLTESLEVGYRLSARGRALLDRLG